MSKEGLRQAYLAYNVLEDPSGEIGHKLVDAVMELCGNDSKKFRDFIHRDPSDSDDSVSEDPKMSAARRFVEDADQLPYDPTATFRNTSDKIDMLKKHFGYENLRGRGGKRVPLAQCNDGLIGSVFSKKYRTSKKLLGEENE